MASSEARRARRRMQALADSGSPIAAMNIDFNRELYGGKTSAKVDAYHRFYWAKILGEALTRIKWVGLPDDIDARFLELVLFTRGYATITHVSGRFLAQMAAPSSLWDEQANFKEWSALGAVGGYTPARNESNSVIVWDNDARFSTAAIVYTLCEDMANAMVTASANLMQQRVGVFFTASKSNMNDAKRLSRSIGLGEVGAVMVNELVDTVGVNVVNPEVPDHTQTAFKARTEYMNEIHAFLGTDFVPHEKESGIQAHEADVGADAIYRQRRLFLAPREKACEQMNELMGWNVSVEWNTGLDSLESEDTADDANAI